MTEPRSAPAEQRSASADDEGDIDLRAIFVVLAQRWMLIRDLVLIALVGSAIVALLSPTAYEATSGVVIAKARTQVNFGTSIKTLSAEEIAPIQADQASRRNTLAGLVKSSAIGAIVIEEIGKDLPDELRSVDRLTQLVDGSIGRSAGDLIEIRMTWGDPAVALRVVDSWSRSYERYVNGIYASSYSPTTSLERERASAKDQYDAALAEYLRVAGSNRTQGLSQQVDDRKLSISVLQQRMDYERDGLVALYATRVRLQQTIEDARTLRGQAAQPGSSPSSNALAIALLKAQIAMPLTSQRDPTQALDRALRDTTLTEQESEQPKTQPAPSPALTIQATLQPGGETAAAQLADLDALVRTIEERLRQIDESIQQRSAAIQRPNPFQADIDGLQKEQLALEAALAREKANLKEATRARDLAWDTYSSLASVVDERSVAEQVGGREVVYAMPARAQLASTLTKRLTPMALAVLGALVAALVVIALIQAVKPDSPTPHIPWTGWLRRRPSP